MGWWWQPNGARPATDPGATQNVASEQGRSAGVLSIGTILTVIGGLTATLLGGGLATRHNEVLDGNTWILLAAHDGVERILRVNPGSGEVDVTSDAPGLRGSPVSLEQSNATTAVVDAATGTAYTWDGVGGAWHRSTTKVSNNTALHLTNDSAFSVDRREGRVRQLDPVGLSASMGPPVRLGASVGASIVDGSGTLWLSLTRQGRVIAVQAGNAGPTVGQEFRLPISGAVPELTALRSGVMVNDLAGRSAYRVIPGRSAVERLPGLPPATGKSATTSDDDTGAVLYPSLRQLARVAPKGDRRARIYSLRQDQAGDAFGKPVVFGDRVYVPDYSTGAVIRTTASGKLEEFLPERASVGAAGGPFDMFVDDGRLWVNARSGARAYTIDRQGKWNSVIKSEPKKIRPPEVRASTPKRVPESTARADGDEDLKKRPTATKAPRPRVTKPQKQVAPARTARPQRTVPVRPRPKPTRTSRPSPTAPAQPPGAPQEVSVKESDGTLQLTWKPPKNRAGTVTGYEVTWIGEAGEGHKGRPADAREIVLKKLRNGLAYTLTIEAVNAAGSGREARVVATPGAAPGVELRNARPSGRGRVALDFTVDSKESGPVTCGAMVGTEKRWEGACQGESTVQIENLQASTEYDVSIVATNTRGESSSGHENVKTWDPPLIQISKGASAVGEPNCHDPSCRWITVHIERFTPNAEYSMDAFDTHQGEDSFPIRTIRAGPDGSTTITGPDKTYYYGFPGRGVTVVVDGLKSNKIMW